MQALMGLVAQGSGADKLDYAGLGLGVLWIGMLVYNHRALVRAEATARATPEAGSGTKSPRSSLPIPLTRGESLVLLWLQVAFVALAQVKAFLDPPVRERLALSAVSLLLALASGVILIKAFVRPRPRPT
jgi:hypothetical protein